MRKPITIEHWRLARVGFQFNLSQVRNRIAFFGNPTSPTAAGFRPSMTLIGVLAWLTANCTSRIFAGGTLSRYEVGKIAQPRLGTSKWNVMLVSFHPLRA